MDRRKAEINLAALLDGELRDPAQVEELNALMERDPALRSEFEAQRDLKAALSSLAPSEEQQAQRSPDFMATRVLGEIAARRKAPRLSIWRPVIAWSGSLAALLIGFFTTVQVMQPMVNTAALTAQNASTGTTSTAQVLPAGLSMDMHYTPQYWQDKFELPAGLHDEKVAGFLKFANEAHNYRRLMHSSDHTTPDMAQAVLAVNSGSGNVVWAADGK